MKLYHFSLRKKKELRKNSKELLHAENSEKMYGEVRYPFMNTSKFYHMLYRLVSDKNRGKCQK